MYLLFSLFFFRWKKEFLHRIRPNTQSIEHLLIQNDRCILPVECCEMNREDLDDILNFLCRVHRASATNDSAVACILFDDVDELVGISALFRDSCPVSVLRLSPVIMLR